MTVNLSLNPQQEEAIYCRGKSILVSAPAGSGKTKVLVDRIVSMLVDENVCIDELLVLTFTSAAASEMKQRLSNTLSNKLTNTDDEDLKNHITKQIQLLPNAYITNFHSFCSTLLKQYGDIINVNSDYQILSDNKLIIEQILSSCINDWFEDEEFIEFISLYFNSGDLNQFKGTLLNLYRLKIGNYNYHQLINDTISQKGQDNIENLGYFSFLLSIFKNAIDDMYLNIQNLYEYSLEHNLDTFYTKDSKNKQSQYDGFISLFNKISSSFETNGVKELSKIEYKLDSCRAMSWINLDDQDGSIKDGFNTIKKTIITNIKSLVNDLLFISDEHIQLSVNLNGEFIYYMDSLVNKFEEAYSCYKKELNVLDFNDLENHCLELLHPDHGVSDLLHTKLKEIMVDEYQDTNLTQETILQMISKSPTSIVPLFMVGDMKQSIYRFRNADHTIFKQKYDEFNNLEDCKRIDLIYNYRSNKIVLDSINYIFHQIMNPQIGGLDYIDDAKAPLNYDYIRKETQFNTTDLDTLKPLVDKRIDELEGLETELLLVLEDSSNKYDKGESEAIAITNRIKEIVGSLQLEDHNKNKRICEYKDIVVLLRNSKHIIAFKKIFDKANIPNNIVLNNGFYQSVEISDSVHFLDAIHNPTNDLSFITLLTSSFNFSGFDEQLIFDINKIKGSHFYNKTKQYALENSNDKLNSFLDIFECFIEMTKTKSIYDIYYKFLNDSQYLTFVSGLYNGHQRSANIEMFLSILESYQKETYDYAITQIVEQSKLEQNSTPGTNRELTSNSVSFMTIHKSKGLEFPVVFVSNLSSNFNKQDNKNYIMNTPYGLATKVKVKYDIDEFNDIVHDIENPIVSAYRRYNDNESINEELRILYVALTRASQKLICTGISSLKQLTDIQYNVLKDSVLNKNNHHHNAILSNATRKVSNPLDWLIMSCVRHPSFIKDVLNDQITGLDQLVEFKDNCKTFEIHNESWPATEHSEFKVRFISIEDLDVFGETISNDSNVLEYKSVNHDVLPITKTIAVTREIEHKTTDIKFDSKLDLHIPANEFGTLIHDLLEKIPFDNIVDIKSKLELIKDTYSVDDYNAIVDYSDKLQAFFDSETYQVITSSDHIFKEKNFSYLNEQKQIVHGILDLVFVKDNKITILDYKTDRVLSTNSDESLQKLHQQQLEYYKSVLQKQFPDYEISCCVYYLHINKIIYIR